jgi:glutaconate CoA-transferase subunit B
VITDKGILEPDPDTCELILTSLHPGVTARDARESIGWDLRVSPHLATTPPPTEEELTVLRGLTDPKGPK